MSPCKADDWFPAGGGEDGISSARTPSAETDVNGHAEYSSSTATDSPSSIMGPAMQIDSQHLKIEVSMQTLEMTLSLNYI